MTAAAATIPAATSASSTTVFKIVATHTCGLNDYYLEDTIVGNKVLKVADRIYVILYIFPCCCTVLLEKSAN